ncbi:MAG: hypothetical protein IKT01_02775 [Eubacteriaceae bacterium]|nr:hypothetical protein [Eubacteriaceae bacterium]
MAVRRKLRGTFDSPADKKRRRTAILRGIVFSFIILAAAAVSALIITQRRYGYIPSIRQMAAKRIEVTLPEDGTEYEIVPGTVVKLDIKTVMTTWNSRRDTDLTEKYKLRMFFSDATICDRPEFNEIALHSDVEPGTTFTVTIVYADQTRVLNFTAVSGLAQPEVNENEDDGGEQSENESAETNGQ